MAITMETIAKEAGVCRETVSFIFNNRCKERRISEETRDRVLSIAEKHNYLPSSTGRSLVKKKTHNIGVSLHSVEYLTQTYFSTIIGGIAHQVGLQDYNMQFEVTDSSGESSKNMYFLKKAKGKFIDGIIIIDQKVSDSEILKLKDMNIPFVLVDRYIPGADVFCVRVDNEKGIYLSTEHLIKRGHKRIAFVCEYIKWNKIIDMFKGYYSALKDYGISSDKELIIDVTGWDVSNKVSTELERIFKIASPPTAIVCSSDLYAVKVLRILKEMEIMVPRDMALVGYNDDPNFIHVEPQLTTVNIPLREMGEESARMIFSLIGGVVPERSEVIVEPTLIVRQSTAFI